MKASADVDLWRRAERVFAAIAECPPEQRDAFVRRSCAGDGALQHALETLLAFEQADFLDQPLVTPLHGDLALPAPPQLGETLGSYRLLRLVGEGGSSRVFMAERVSGDFAQMVAVKLIRARLLSPVMHRRFQRERAILAELQHPNIARLLDSGVTSAGQPYVVLEYVAGLPMTRYCDERQLSVARRLEIFRAVCAAVQHAHTQLVIHRDIKPSNVLVTDEGEPKLLDFGIAQRLWTEPRAPAGDNTVTGERALTPDYASPEQLAGAPLTTATDVYSLGVVLHELLVGCRPAQPVASGEIRTPSACLGGGDGRTRDESEAVAAARGRLTARQLRRRVAGDLDHIVLRALALAPSARYGSVEQLAADVTRHLAGQPVLAARQRLAYRARKFVWRNALAVALGSVAALCLGALVVVLLQQDTRIRRERDAARASQARAEAITRFLVDAFDVADPSNSRGATVTAREVLDRSAQRVASSLAGEPALQSSLMSTIGGVYANLGLRPAARAQLEAAYALRVRLYGESSAEAAESLTQLGLLRHEEGDDPGAEATLRRAVEIQRRTAPADSLPLANSVAALGYLLRDRGDYAAAEPLIREALDLRRRELGSDHVEVAATLTHLAILLQRKGVLEEAERCGLEALANFRRIGRADHPKAADALVVLAVLKDVKGDGAGAEALYRQALAVRRRAFGERHPAVATTLVGLASVLRTRGDYAGAEVAARSALEMNREILPPDHPELATSLTNLAMILRDKGDPAAAEPLLREALERARRAMGPDDPDVAAHAHNLASVLLDEGQVSAADKVAQEALAVRRRRLGPRHWQVGNTLALYADIQRAAGHPDLARTLAQEAVDSLEAALPRGHWRSAVARGILGDCLVALGRLEEAGPLVADSLAALRAAQGSASYEARRAQARAERYETGTASVRLAYKHER
jgi:eukaryotic-like serine/threonine-protein kinase